MRTETKTVKMKNNRIVKVFTNNTDLKVEILKVAKNKYFNYYYAYDMKNPAGRAGAFKTKREAVKMARKHRPTIK